MRCTANAQIEAVDKYVAKPFFRQAQLLRMVTEVSLRGKFLRNKVASPMARVSGGRKSFVIAVTCTSMLPIASASQSC